jgi:hypothetical protein
VKNQDGSGEFVAKEVLPMIEVECSAEGTTQKPRLSATPNGHCVFASDLGRCAGWLNLFRGRNSGLTSIQALSVKKRGMGDFEGLDPGQRGNVIEESASGGPAAWIWSPN